MVASVYIFNEENIPEGSCHYLAVAVRPTGIDRKHTSMLIDELCSLVVVRWSN